MDAGKYVLVTSCRVCGARLEPILNFGYMPLANQYPVKPDVEQARYPLEVVLCTDCGCVQLRHTVDPKLLFEEYLYTSSTSGSLAEHFKQYALDTVKNLSLKTEEDFIVGIGGNDGPLERAYKDLGFDVLNVEASRNIALLSVANRVLTLNAWFNEYTATAIVNRHGQASLITCNNCFAHMPDIHTVIRAIKILLKPGGWFVCENAYWRDEVRGNHFDHIYHEHCFYWTIKALDELFRSHGLTISSVEFNQSQGGSIRVFVQRACDTIKFSWVRDFIHQEELERLFDPLSYVAWTERIIAWQSACRDFIEPLDSICCYGVPAKFTMLSEQLNFSPEKIVYAVDDSPIKVGRFTPGAHIPIVDRQHFIANPTKYCIITASNYAARIVEANPQFSGKWIVLNPEPVML